MDISDGEDWEIEDPNFRVHSELPEIEFDEALQNSQTMSLSERAQPLLYSAVLGETIPWRRIQFGLCNLPANYSYGGGDFLRFLKIKGVMPPHVRVYGDELDEYVLPEHLHVLYPWNTTPNHKIKRLPCFYVSDALRWRYKFPQAWYKTRLAPNQELTEAQRDEADKEARQVGLEIVDAAEGRIAELRMEVMENEKQAWQIRCKMAANLRRFRALDWEKVGIEERQMRAPALDTITELNKIQSDMQSILLENRKLHSKAEIYDVWATNRSQALAKLVTSFQAWVETNEHSISSHQHTNFPEQL